MCKKNGTDLGDVWSDESDQISVPYLENDLKLCLLIKWLYFWLKKAFKEIFPQNIFIAVKPWRKVNTLVENIAHAGSNTDTFHSI